MPSLAGLISEAVSAAPSARMSCSSMWSTRALDARWRSCTHACHVCLDAARSHSRHCPPKILYSTTHCCSRVTEPSTSPRTVSFTLSRLECGSVHTKDASTSFTREVESVSLPWLKPLSFLRHRASRGWDSSSAWIHCGLRCHAPHTEHRSMPTIRGMRSVMSTAAWMQARHWPRLLGSVGVPQVQHGIWLIARGPSMAARGRGGKATGGRPKGGG
mmetsp:Transcript_16402/g.55179  ORF Transcript_16402/g.55179 Transcript_16402/m.55179 type:complete len:216 (+) Transcript_16402:242-889(+)